MGQVDAILDILESESKEALVARFEDLYGHPPPKRMQRGLILMAVAYRIQANAQGGPNLALRRRLAKLADELRRTGKISTQAKPSTKAGTRFLRDWQGETHSVTVLDDGCLYRGERYRSLSVIARRITGTRWSGPAFFGVNSKGAGA